MYKGRTFTRETTYTCGNYFDGAIYPVFQKPGVRRAKSKPTSEVQAHLNRTNALKHLVRLINANFVKGDYELTPTYDDDHLPGTFEQAERDIKNFIRRIKRAWKKAGIVRPLKYCYRLDVSEDGRFHAHMFLTAGLDRDLIEDLWGKGWANTIRMMPRNDGLAGLSEYVGGKELVEGDKRLSYRRWSRSKNFIVPEPAQRDAAFTVAQVRQIADAFEKRRVHEYFEALYPGYRLVEARFDHNGFNRGYYFYFQMVRESAYIDTKLMEYAISHTASLFLRGMTKKRKKRKNAKKDKNTTIQKE